MQPPDETRMQAIKQFKGVLETLGIPVDDNDHTRETPRRWVDMMLEYLNGDPWVLTTFPTEHSSVPGSRGDSGMVTMSGIPFQSLCAHHLAPFHGQAHIAYVPKNQLVGLSKLARMIGSFSKGLQVQEGIGTRAADWFMDAVDPYGIMIVLEAEHTCYTLRGIKAHGSRTVTSVVRGVFFNDQRAREEALMLFRGFK